MALAKSFAVSLMGLEGAQIEVEVDISNSLPGFVLVGLPDASLSEAAARVRAACVNSGFELPAKKITVNLSPASVPKFGSSFDLAIALGILAATKKIKQETLSELVCIGELGLDGSLRRVNGVLPLVLQAKKLGFTKVAVPISASSEANLVEGMTVVAANSLGSLVALLNGASQEISQVSVPEPTSQESDLDLSDVAGQPDAIFAMLVAAAGRHNISMVGSPGAGKTMLAERLPTILPELNQEQAIEVAAIHSLVGSGQVFSGTAISRSPQFQAPHHSASMASVIGGGLGLPRPGAISLAHHGVLFLDEITEFQNNVLQSLREPLESRKITISRSAGQAIYPANFQLVVAANPCACGNYGSAKLPCSCSVVSRQKYLNRLKGPLFDRIDLRLQIQPVGTLLNKLMQDNNSAMTSAQARLLTTQARLASRERLSKTRFESNAEVSASYLRGKLKLSPSSTKSLVRALDKGLISMRGYDRCLRVAWTIADIEGATSPDESMVARAMTLRGADA